MVPLGPDHPKTQRWLPTTMVCYFSVFCGLTGVLLRVVCLRWPCPALSSAQQGHRKDLSTQSLVQTELPHSMEIDWLPKWQAHCASTYQACSCPIAKPRVSDGRGGREQPQGVNTGCCSLGSPLGESATVPLFSVAQLTNTRFSERPYEF